MRAGHRFNGFNWELKKGLNMDAQLKAKWIEALRSGEYPQGNGFLEKDGHYCCLGVLCAIQDEQWKKQFEGGSLYTETPPESLNGGLSGAERRELAKQNDIGIKFVEIADYIENNL